MKSALPRLSSIARPAAIGSRAGMLAPLLLLLVCALLPYFARASEVPQTPGAFPPALGIRIDLSSAAVQFFQDGRPGLIDGYQQVELRVTCFSGSSSIAAEASPLVGQQNRRQIGPERLFIRSNSTQPQPDVGAGPGFVPMDAPVLVAQGSVPTYSTPVELRLLTFWSDTPGIYKGDILFTAVVRP